MCGAKALPPIIVLELEGWVLVIVVDRENPLAYYLVEVSNLFDHYGADRAMGTLMLRFAIHFKEVVEVDRVPSLILAERPGWRA